MIEMPSVRAYGEKKQSLAWPCPRPLMTVFYTHPADQSVANPPQEGQGHYQKFNTFCFCSYHEQG
jgi:hypothetical protein